jgi:hypothetical protein
VLFGDLQTPVRRETRLRYHAPVFMTCCGMDLPSLVRGYTTAFLKIVKSMKLPLKTIIVIAALSGLFCSATAHESRQPTGLIAPNSEWKYDDDGAVDAGWETSEFNDESWGTATSPLGYGERYLNQPLLQKGKLDYY